MAEFDTHFKSFEQVSAQHGLFFESLITLNECKHIVEIGTAFATTTKFLCRGAKQTGGTVYAYDLWDEHGLENQFQQLSTKEKCNEYLLSHNLDNFVLTKIDSKAQEFKNTINTEHPVIDFAFIDGCHSYDGVKNDFDIIYPKLSPTGIIAFHDTLKIDGCRELIIDLRTKLFDGTFDIVDFPFGAGERRCGVSLLVKRSYHTINIPCDEVCNIEDRCEEVYQKEKEWYKSEIKSKQNEYKVLLTTSGVGSRLGNLTNYTNKSLVRVGDKAAISHIIDAYPQETEFVVTLGHFGSHVKQYLSLAHPDCNIQFVEVDNYADEGSSLLYSISLCEEYLQCPFIFHACDTILPENYLDKVKTLSSNWSIGSRGDDSQSYRTINTVNGKIVSINEKGEQNFDFAYVGVSGIQQHKVFWDTCKTILENSRTSDLSDCHIIREMDDFFVVDITEWHDIGNIDALKKARSKIKSTINVLEKEKENIFVFDDFVIKFFHDIEVCHNRVLRTESLTDIVPALLDSTENFCKYEYVEGDLLADVVDLEKFENLLSWSKDNLWIEKHDTSYKQNALSFYKTKTQDRVGQFLEKYNLDDKEDIINGANVPCMRDLLNQIDYDSIIGASVRFHGDFVLDNILIDNGKFTLIDWRQDFNGDIEVGDINYDLAKLNHNLTLNHEILTSGQYSIDLTTDNIRCDLHVKKTLLDCQILIEKFCKEQNISYDAIKLLSSIIWINMSPLHEQPLDMFLYYFGKYNLFLNLK